MTKKNIMPVVVLIAICTVVAALLAGVNMLTKDKIKENAILKEQASLIKVLPTEAGFDQIYSASGELPEGAVGISDELKAKLPKSVTAIYREKNGAGFVFAMATSTQYSSGDMTASVGISDGKVVGVSLTSYQESKDFGKDSYPDKFVGATAGSYSSVELVSGVTYSSSAFRDDVIGAALEAAALLDEANAEASSVMTLSAAAPIDEAEADLDALIKELVPGKEINEIALPEGAPEALKKLYTVKNDGYVAYLVVPGAYIPVATKALVHIGADGVIKNINLLSWIVGHGVEAGDFAEGFIGKDVWNYGKVELVSGATGTSADFYNALNPILEMLTDTLAGARDKRFLAWVDRMIPNSGEIVKVDLPKDAPSTLVALYQDTTGRGSVAYIVVPGAYVPVAAEALVYFDEFGVIRDVDLRSWVVGHGVEPGDFAEGFIGKNAETISEVELVTAATGTSSDFKAAVEAAMPYIPVSPYTYRIVGAAVLAAAIIIFVSVLIITNRRRGAK